METLPILISLNTRVNLTNRKDIFSEENFRPFCSLDSKHWRLWVVKILEVNSILIALDEKWRGKELLLRKTFQLRNYLDEKLHRERWREQLKLSIKIEELLMMFAWKQFWFIFDLRFMEISFAWEAKQSRKSSNISIIECSDVLLICQCQMEKFNAKSLHKDEEICSLKSDKVFECTSS